MSYPFDNPFADDPPAGAGSTGDYYSTGQGFDYSSYGGADVTAGAQDHHEPAETGYQGSYLRQAEPQQQQQQHYEPQQQHYEPQEQQDGDDQQQQQHHQQETEPEETFRGASGTKRRGVRQGIFEKNSFREKLKMT